MGVVYVMLVKIDINVRDPKGKRTGFFSCLTNEFSSFVLFKRLQTLGSKNKHLLYVFNP